MAWILRVDSFAMGKSSRLKIERKSQESEAKQVQLAREAAHKLMAEVEFPLGYPLTEITQIMVLSESVYEQIVAAGIRSLGKGVSQDSLADFSCESHLALDKYQAIAARIFREHVKVEPDCKPGCNWCCYPRVTLKVSEAAQIHRAIEALPADKRTEISQRMTTFVEATNAMSPAAVLRSTRLCPLNENGNCLIYADRPLTCRTVHSYNVRTCRAYVETGAMVASRTSIFSHEIGRFAATAITQVLAHYGADQRSFELNDLVLGLLTDNRVGTAIGKKKTTALDPYHRGEVESAAITEIGSILGK